MLAMIAHPAAQARAQAELDAVVWRARAPTAVDLVRPPYVRATVREALHWRPVTPAVLGHRARADGWYEGMFLPAGTILAPSIWAMNREPYSADADAFEPARHVDARGELDTRDEGHVTYGFRRRICVGRGVANASLAMHAAVALWACVRGRAKDERGRDVPVDVDGYT
ncbi:cytochrome P450 [Auriscalpium vulgare]|uniref:Cytochrome P450 n=1 Tax=Auriscalpium vulgare TaxID=40419 RepID=A0ACB8RUC8_9AGAM|nr:cytochrome P450 [Auriscalpium vulgare]